MGTKPKLGGLMQVDAVCFGSRIQPRCWRKDSPVGRHAYPPARHVLLGAVGNQAWRSFEDPPSIGRGRSYAPELGFPCIRPVRWPPAWSMAASITKPS